jgi:hypothetical protein
MILMQLSAKPVCELPEGSGVEPPAIGANPLADCTSDPSGGGVEGIDERERKRGEGRIPYFDPLLFSDNSHPG